MYKLEIISDTEWDKIVGGSTQGNYFVTSKYLSVTGRESSKYALVKNDQIEALTVIDNHNANVCNSRFSVYQGLIYSEKNNDTYSQILKRIEIQSYLLTLLLEKYCELHFSMHPSINDIRGFQFFESENRSINFQYTPSYTGVINLSKHETFAKYLASVQANRRQEFKKITEDNFRIKNLERDIDIFLQIYEETFERENYKVEQSDLNLISNIIRSLEGKEAIMHLLYNLNSEVKSGLLLGLYEKVAYYHFAGSIKNEGNTSFASRQMLLLIKELFEMNIDQFDLVGLNSPKRAYFKTTFNPELKQYFDIRVSKGTI
jgi:hypothetical protein